MDSLELPAVSVPAVSERPDRDEPVSVSPLGMTREAKLFADIGGHPQVLRMTTIFYEVRYRYG